MRAHSRQVQNDMENSQRIKSVTQFHVIRNFDWSGQRVR